MNNFHNKQSNTGYPNKNEVRLQTLLKMPDNQFIMEDNYIDSAMECFSNMKVSITSSKLRSLFF